MKRTRTVIMGAAGRDFARPRSWTRARGPWGRSRRRSGRYPNVGTLLPAMGYGDAQVKDLVATIDKVPCDTVIIGTPIDLNRLVRIRKPTVPVRYELREIGKPDL